MPFVLCARGGATATLWGEHVIAMEARGHVIYRYRCGYIAAPFRILANSHIMVNQVSHHTHSALATS